MKTRPLMAALALLAAQATAWATPASPEAVERLLVVTRAERMNATMLQQVNTMMEGSIRQVVDADASLSAAQRQQAERAVQGMSPRLQKILAEEMSWRLMKPFVVKMYQETFSQEEIDGLTDFYEGPLGIALLDKMPLVMQKSIDWSQQRMPFILQRVQAMVEEEKARLARKAP